MKFSLSSRLLVGRLLTRSGDQAWDFAVPIILLKILPNHLRIAALYYFLIKLAGVLILPRIATTIDTKDRMSAVRLGLSFQFFGVLLGACGIYLLSSMRMHDPAFDDPGFLAIFCLLVFGGILGSLGASLMDIVVANDLAPSVFEGRGLAWFNSRFRQIDLLTEVGAPVVAGLILATQFTALPLAGFLFVALWNLVSFFPEYGLLRSIFGDRPDLQAKPIQVGETVSKFFLERLHTGWRAFFREPVAPAMIAYALLWLSVLSPHGVLLTGFLQDGWRLPEWMIGIFRGSGALFGLMATILFPLAFRSLSIKATSHLFLGFQALMMLGACGLFLLGGSWSQIGFLIMILFSRVGLYGFSLGEVQIRQEGISPSVRGQVNGFASALTSLATLALFAFGSVLPSTEDFKYLVFLSTFSVCLAFWIFTVWTRGRR